MVGYYQCDNCNRSYIIHEKCILICKKFTESLFGGFHWRELWSVPAQVNIQWFISMVSNTSLLNFLCENKFHWNKWDCLPQNWASGFSCSCGPRLTDHLGERVWLIAKHQNIFLEMVFSPNSKNVSANQNSGLSVIQVIPALQHFYLVSYTSWLNQYIH